ncbi:hypothetical protein HUW46_00376 [Amycolatopsis sp. CA-230715]|nr:hypothetical protein HUW46_00376 [Amycolatopsis sp. CA-230715]
MRHHGVMATKRTGGDVDVARTASLFADPARVRVLMALTDGRSLAASVLAMEAGLSAQGVSSHLAKLRDAGLVTAEKSGRHRFYRLSGPRVAELIESLASFSPVTEPVRSLKAGTRAEALRRARTCYDHLAGRLGVAVTTALLDRGALVSLDGVPTTVRRDGDRISSPLQGHPYALGPEARPVFAKLGVDVDEVTAARRPPLKFCLDWSEQRHHLAGGLGAALADAVRHAGWVQRRQEGHRALRVTEDGARRFKDLLGVELS